MDAGALVISMFVCGSAYFNGPSSDLLLLMHDDRERATTAIVAGAPDQIGLKSLYAYPDMDIISSVPYLASNRLSVFHSNIDYFLYQIAHNALHKPLPDGMLLDGEWCAGAFEDIDKVVGRSSSTWNQISGWLLDRGMELTADGVLFTDEQGRLAGIGRMLLARPDVDKAMNSKHTQMVVHYIGYVELNTSRGTVIGYAFKADRNNLCRFGERKIGP